MNVLIPSQPDVQYTHAPSAAARQLLFLRRGEPLFYAAWERALMIHFEVDAEALQSDVPFRLDLWNGRAFVSLVAFTMRGMRPRFGGRLAALLFRPIATHDFLNVRTYVRHGDECGIHFLGEWLSNRLAVWLGPSTFGLPYRYGTISYDHNWKQGMIRGEVDDTDSGACLSYRAMLMVPKTFRPSAAGSLDEWLMERYTAFNSIRDRKRFFRVWHPPWPRCPAEVKVSEISLMTKNWPWFERARLVGAAFSRGFQEVWMGHPHHLHLIRST